MCEENIAPNICFLAGSVVLLRQIRPESGNLFLVQDEPKSGLCDFLEENSIDLVIVGYVSTSRLRKTLNVRSLTLRLHEPSHMTFCCVCSSATNL